MSKGIVLINEMIVFRRKEEYFHKFTYKSLATGALTLEIIVIADNKLMDFCYRCYK